MKAESGAVMDSEKYRISGAESLITPALVYYKDIIEANTDRLIALSGGADRLWPHVKTHKMGALVKHQMARGITRFKCATIAEAEMAAMCAAEDILVAYPLVGPNIGRFLKLRDTYPYTRFWALGDDIEQLRLLGAEALTTGEKVRLLIDVDLGMDRTGVPLDKAAAFFQQCAELEGLAPLGLHCFNGNYKIADPAGREAAVNETLQAVFDIRALLKQQNYGCSVLILGSTPSLPCYAKYDGIFLSPGTAFVTDYGYWSLFRDLAFEPGAAVLTRVISRTKTGVFTLDLGYKSIAADPKGLRGVILGYEDAEPLFQCEEHWTFKMRDGEENKAPETGTLLYVIPTHICPTTALYPYALVAEGRRIVTTWDVSARNRQITI